MPETGPGEPVQRNNLWPSIRTVEDAQMETAMGTAGLFLGIIGTVAAMLGHHHSVWHVLAVGTVPEGLDPARLVPTLLAGQIAAFAIFAVQLWRGAALGLAVLSFVILAAEFAVRVVTGAGAHMVFLHMAATAYCLTAVRASWFIRRSGMAAPA